MDDPRAIERWLDATVVETPTARSVRERSEREGYPRLAPQSAALLRVLARAADARRVLEVGTCLGYSTLFLAEAVGPEGRVETIEMDPGLAAEARAAVREAGFAPRVDVLVGRALDVLPALEGPYDLAFLDADKREYTLYLDHALRLVRPGGLVVADNALWSGRVADPAARDADTEGIRAYVRRITSDPSLASAVVPVGDGLAIAVRSG